MRLVARPQRESELPLARLLAATARNGGIHNRRPFAVPVVGWTQVDLLQSVIRRIRRIGAVQSMEGRITRIGVVVVGDRYARAGDAVVGPEATVASGDPIVAERVRATVIEFEALEHARAANDGEVVGDAF